MSNFHIRSGGRNLAAERAALAMAAARAERMVAIAVHPAGYTLAAMVQHGDGVVSVYARGLSPEGKERVRDALTSGCYTLAWDTALDAALRAAC